MTVEKRNIRLGTEFGIQKQEEKYKNYRKEVKKVGFWSKRKEIEHSAKKDKRIPHFSYQCKKKSQGKWMKRKILLCEIMCSV